MQPDLFTGSAAGRTDAPEVLTDLEVDYTPEGVVVQLLLALRQLRPRFAPSLVLDPAAGSGVFGRGVRAVFGPVPICVGIDMRESESENLERAYDDLLEVTLGRNRPERYDFVVGNPPFSAFEDDGWPNNFRERGLLAPGALVAFYGLSQWGQTDEAAATMQRWAPSAQLRLGGRPQHRGEGTLRWAPIPKKRRVVGGPTHEWRENGGDAREYCLWIWDLADFGRSGPPTWTTVQLPVLPIDFRRWRPDAVPGTRPIDHSLVELIRGRYL